MKKLIQIVIFSFLILFNIAYSQYTISSSSFSNGIINSSNSSYSLKGVLGNITTGKSSGINYYLNSTIFTMTSIESIEEILPDSYMLYNNYPNPFNPTTAISFQLSAVSDVKLSIYDMNGKKVATLINDNKPAGYYELNWDASNFSSGIYFYRLQAGDFIDTKKMVFMK
jgi:type IX secretion system substrate protein